MVRFILFVSIVEVMILLGQQFIYTHDDAYRNLQSVMSEEKAREVIAFVERWWWVAYVATPLEHVIRMSFAFFCLLVGFQLCEKEVSNRGLFQACLNAEYVTLIPSLVILICILMGVDITVSELSQLSHASVYAFFESMDPPSWFRYPLKKLNVIELLYVVVLATGVKKLFQSESTGSTRTVLASYGSGLMLWFVVVIYLRVTLSS